MYLLITRTFVKDNGVFSHKLMHGSSRFTRLQNISPRTRLIINNNSNEIIPFSFLISENCCVLYSVKEYLAYQSK